MTEPVQPTRCAIIAIVGRPNVGKSTLLNTLVGQKLSITSPRPQTTRLRLSGVLTQGDAQFVFVDTPGLQARPRRGLNRSMNQEALRAFDGVDAVLMVVEALRWTEEDAAVARQAAGSGVPVVLGVNKTDKIDDKTLLLPYLEQVAAAVAFEEIIPLSAWKGTNLDALRTVLARYLKPGPFLFPADAVTDRTERFLAAEIVREKLMRHLGKELPYSVSVIVEEFSAVPGSTRINVTIWVEKASQKAIVIGAGGAMLKRIGSEARQDLQAMLGGRVHLETWVKVKERWADDARALAQLGFDG